MIPKIFVKDHGYPHASFAPFGIAPAIARVDFVADPQSLVQTGIEISPNANIETILQVHRRKMLRRAANRRSAQLSRARKKAHLEELKQENSKLQRLVDVLDSQPELVFCATPLGKLTYVSERTINFIKINYAGEDSDEDPTHIGQILSKESVDKVLETIAQLQQYSLKPAGDTDLNMLFSVKEVYFHDAFGHPMVGYLRCSKVHRRTSLQDLQLTDSMEKVASGNTAQVNSSSGPQPKKLKRGHSDLVNGDSNTDAAQTSEPPAEGWNLSNFKMLADYASNFTDEVKEDEDAKESRDTSSKSQSSGSAATADPPRLLETPSLNTASDEDEFVCVVRTSESCFVPYRSHGDLLMFSSVLSAASIEAHDLETRNGQRRTLGSSPSDSNNSNGQLNSESSSNQQKNSTSSEAGSDDNNAEVDSN